MERIKKEESMILILKKDNEEVLKMSSEDVEAISLERNVEFLNTVARIRFNTIEDGYKKMNGVDLDGIDNYLVKSKIGEILETSKRFKVASVMIKSDAASDAVKNKTASWILTLKEV